MSLEALRRKINSVDKNIVDLLNKRADITSKIGSLKRKAGKSVYSPEREREVLRRAIAQNKGPLTSEAIEAVYREIMSCSLSLEKPLKVAYLGPEASFSHQAALKRFGLQVEYLACNSISDVFSEVEKENAEYGVVPIENSVEGVISHTLDMFVDSNLKICSQVVLDVSHNLLANCPRFKIKRVYSNPNVFGQCRIWLRENLPSAERIEVASTTRAAQIASKEKGSACIAALLAAKVYKLKILDCDIQDSAHNITRFLVIGQAEVPKTSRDKTSLMFSIKDKVGALHEMLLPFKKYKINLTKIESRPSKKKAWDYYFFVDLEGHKDSPKVKKAILELENKCKFLKILGSYPIGDNE
ncbi:MAG: prephenate dehydratase [Candidatus Omnitrophica bacterium]|nr:prephenate dehydratase [Candidatus Omnitrophota bacterium]